MNDVKIIPPEGYEIDKENSTFECIKFKPKPKELTYDDISKELFYENTETYYITTGGIIDTYFCCTCQDHKNNAISKKQCERLLAINQLMNVAYYFNEIVDKNVKLIRKFIPEITVTGEIITGYYIPERKNGIVYFKTEESLKKAIKILGEKTVKLAISL